MQIEIFNVGHGACAVVTSPNGKRMMIDCGSAPSQGWTPSGHFQGETIDILAISNYDEDHVSDFENMRNQCNISRYQLNNTITAKNLADMKASDGMGIGIQTIHTILTSAGAGNLEDPLDLSPVNYRVYCNTFGADFTDTNNLSLVLIIEYLGFKIVFPGDLEEAGWRKLLENQAFAQDLASTSVFVASHHGRRNGCCEDVFGICRPAIVIMSDKDKEFDSQETVPWYRDRTIGIPSGNQTRNVYTTRSDGGMLISIGTEGPWVISIGR